MCERGPPGAVIDQLDRQGKTGEQHARPGDGVGPREYSRDRAETSGEEQVRVRRAVTVRCEPPVETSRPERADDPHDRRGERRLVRHEHVVRGEVDRDEQRPDHEERPPRLLDAWDTVAQEAGAQEPERPDDHERETYGVRDLLARDVHEDESRDDDEERAEVEEQARGAFRREQALGRRRSGRPLAYRRGDRRAYGRHVPAFDGRHGVHRRRHDRRRGLWRGRLPELPEHRPSDSLRRVRVQDAATGEIVEPVQDVPASEELRGRRRGEGPTARQTEAGRFRPLLTTAEVAAHGH